MDMYVWWVFVWACMCVHAFVCIHECNVRMCLRLRAGMSIYVSDWFYTCDLFTGEYNFRKLNKSLKIKLVQSSLSPNNGFIDLTTLIRC